ncbi:SCO3374 family protein [Streptomyces sp. NBC_01619]|uniref:SCO3374 family protein n=1 Tax=Streptomyces pratisoli TaxID=3139917 RepID=A0ACC6QKY7_9ACTN|nr:MULTISPECIES: SCO3374 family protein [unclassified Streptomyces]MCX4512422.1 SCO3374 family protein [Streptomyces sp. NBC_01619]
MAFTLPVPRAPLDDSSTRWYEYELGWATAEGPPVQLLTGLRFDVLELPADAGFALLRRCGRTGPVALAGSRMRFLVAAGSAEELPGLLGWLEWGGIALDLTALGPGGSIPAPVPHVRAAPSAPPQGAAVWLRPPEPGHEVEPSLPAFAALGRRAGPGGGGGTPDLVRLVDAAANACHRARLVRTNAAGPHAHAQPLAFS